MRPRILLAAAVLVLAVAGVAYAVGWSDTQANSPQVAGQPSSDDTARFPTNKQNEPSIAVNPVDSSRLIAGSNDEQEQPACGAAERGPDSSGSDCGFFPDVGTSGVYTSGDGGGTWVNRGLLPGFTDGGDSGRTSPTATP